MATVLNTIFVAALKLEGHVAPEQLLVPVEENNFVPNDWVSHEPVAIRARTHPGYGVHQSHKPSTEPESTQLEQVGNLKCRQVLAEQARAPQLHSDSLAERALY